MNLDAFEQLVRSRRAVRNFKPDPVPEELLRRLLDAARWAPSGYNLQPARFHAVTDPAARERLFTACLDQRQVREAPATVVFTGDRDCFLGGRYPRILAMDLESGAISPEYKSLMEKIVPLAFGRAPLGLGALAKRILVPFLRLMKPTPDLPAYQMDFWLAKQVMLGAMNFMLAAEAAGLATVPMEGFDPVRVRRALSLPRSEAVILVVPVGYEEGGGLTKTRLPLDEYVGEAEP